MSRKDWKRPSSFKASVGRRRVALEVQYNGTNFCGWQSQEGSPSVQDTLIDAVKELTHQNNIEVCGSGRTDSGVHAYGQVAHIEMDECSIPGQAFCPALNALLPYSIRIKKSYDVGPDFHARYSAMAREYRYFSKVSNTHDAFTEGEVTHLKEIPDIDKLNEMANLVKGSHDFTTFASSKDICPSKFRDIYESEFYTTKDMYGETILVYKIVGNAFLYHMVRSLVGTMLEFTSCNKSAEDFKKTLEAKDRSKAGKTAPSDGLYLWRVSYDPDEYAWFEEQNGNC